jgi:hypothetical protein
LRDIGHECSKSLVRARILGAQASQPIIDGPNNGVVGATEENGNEAGSIQTLSIRGGDNVSESRLALSRDALAALKGGKISVRWSQAKVRGVHGRGRLRKYRDNSESNQACRDERRIE